jgi:hypothetical protein
MRVFVTYHYKHEDILGKNKSWKKVNAVHVVLGSSKEVAPLIWFRRTCNSIFLLPQGTHTPSCQSALFAFFKAILSPFYPPYNILEILYTRNWLQMGFILKYSINMDFCDYSRLITLRRSSLLLYATICIPGKCTVSGRTCGYI